MTKPRASTRKSDGDGGLLRASLREDYLNQVQRDFLSESGFPDKHP